MYAPHYVKSLGEEQTRKQNFRFWNFPVRPAKIGAVDIFELEKTIGLSIPDAIKNKVTGLDFVVDKVGLSQSLVALSDEVTLKISSLSFDIDNEMRNYRSLKDKLPIPEILECVVDDGRIYLLKRKLKGKMLCHADYMGNPDLLYSLASEAIRRLWSVDINGLDLQDSWKTVMDFGRYHLREGNLDFHNADQEIVTGFSGFAEILNYLEEKKPKSDLSLVHGDLCLTNIICDEDRLVGFIDLGLTGISDHYHDLAILYRSIKYNFAGRYGKPYPGYEENKLFDMLGIAKDEQRIRYYLLLDEVLG